MKMISYVNPFVECKYIYIYIYIDGNGLGLNAQIPDDFSTLACVCLKNSPFARHNDWYVPLSAILPSFRYKIWCAWRKSSKLCVTIIVVAWHAKASSVCCSCCATIPSSPVV